MFAKEAGVGSDALLKSIKCTVAIFCNASLSFHCKCHNQKSRHCSEKNPKPIKLACSMLDL